MSLAIFLFMPNRNLKASKDCEFRLCRDEPDDAGAARVATELIRHAACMTRAQPLCGKALFSSFGNTCVSIKKYFFLPPK